MNIKRTLTLTRTLMAATSYIELGSCGMVSSTRGAASDGSSMTGASTLA